jgi:hypothetical protein
MGAEMDEVSVRHPDRISKATESGQQEFAAWIGCMPGTPRYISTSQIDQLKRPDHA